MRIRMGTWQDNQGNTFAVNYNSSKQSNFYQKGQEWCLLNLQTLFYGKTQKLVNIECPDLQVTQNDAFVDQLKDKNNRIGLMHCYCLDQFFKINISVNDIQFQDGEKYCSEYSFNQSQGVLIIVVNINFGSNFSAIGIFQGKYKEFTVEWHKDIGATITEYENIYTGPEFLMEFRYSSILTQLYIILMYSPGMPILYLIAFFSFFLTYWFDKFFLSLMYYAVIFHFFIGLYILICYLHKICKNQNNYNIKDDMTFSDDYYRELNFSQLFKEWVRTNQESFDFQNDLNNNKFNEKVTEVVKRHKARLDHKSEEIFKLLLVLFKNNFQTNSNKNCKKMSRADFNKILEVVKRQTQTAQGPSKLKDLICTYEIKDNDIYFGKPNEVQNYFRSKEKESQFYDQYSSEEEQEFQP
ncbi:UNKNOWN [Stylonychia lemnae]|uniref:Transmembrane protein n=1 Tax=Stylonychia lemnae TaxID=5949 RepID=A0A078APS2_STYLE|nr:UNKNOWN [Stylonychia lemnae]|eukprot:CDW82913.1 UNKNOWN [Stylonychia lemnae]